MKINMRKGGSMKDNKRQPRGQSLVELAVGTVVLLLLLGSAVDLGRLFFSFIALRDAAQEGATYASAQGTASNTVIEERIRASSTRPVDLSDTSNVGIQVSRTGTCSGDAVSVQVSINSFEMIMPFTSIIANHFPIHAKVVNTILFPACN
jgi:Flp pilus assembly protein TadG